LPNSISGKGEGGLWGGLF